jgi:hypothetical protein
MSKKGIVAVGLVLSAGVAVSGAACWRTLRNGTFTESACTAGSFSLTAAFVPPYDYAELRESDGAGNFRLLESAGARCAKASTPEACEAAFKSASSKTGWSNASGGRMPGHRYVVATRGDEVKVIEGDLGRALAPIDSAVKSAAVASIQRGIGVSCEKSVRKVEGGGFEVHLETSSCFGPRDEVIRVAPDGVTTVVSAEQGPQTCVGENVSAPDNHGTVAGAPLPTMLSCES